MNNDKTKKIARVSASYIVLIIFSLIALFPVVQVFTHQPSPARARARRPDTDHYAEASRSAAFHFAGNHSEGRFFEYIQNSFYRTSILFVAYE
jgi:ABC-type maltose transport system permease subunit